MHQEFYQTIKIIKETNNKKIEIVYHEIEQLFYIRKTFNQYDISLYQKLMRINSPYIIKIKEIEEINNQLVIIEEYRNTHTLAYYLENKELNKEIHSIMNELFEVLNLLHTQGIIHRDIKPENILIDEHCLLFDFDISRQYMENKTHDTVISGTLGYLAPEQLGYKQTDKRADIFSLGKLLEDLSHYYDEDYTKVIKKATSFNPEDRYQTINEMKEAMKIKRDYRLPGYRSGKKEYKVLATLFYGIFLLSYTFVRIDGYKHLSIQELIDKWPVAFVFIPTVIILGDYLGINQYLLHIHTDNKWIKYSLRLINLVIVDLFIFLLIGIIQTSI